MSATALDPLLSHDPIAERRYDYAKAAAEEGDWSTAAEILEQALERAPNWAPAWFALGEARERQGDASRAAAAFAAALVADPSDLQGAGARLGLLDGGQATAALPRAYVARLFDDYADRFDAHLTGGLSYRGPELILAVLDRIAPKRRFPAALDLGCGTGLAGAALRPRVGALVGVDLSSAMISKARRTGLYDALEVGDAVEFLGAAKRLRFNLIVAADVVAYLGDLEPLFAAVKRALARNGLFIFSFESFVGEGFRLGPKMRFHHAKFYVETRAKAAGLRIADFAEAAVRQEAGLDAPGWLATVARN